MNIELLQDIRYKLQKRVRRLHSSTSSQYRYLENLRQFRQFIENTPSILGVLEQLDAANTEIEIVTQSIQKGGTNLEGLTEEQQAASAYTFIKQCTDSPNTEEIWQIGKSLDPDGQGGLQDCMDAFHEILVEALYEYIDEKLDDQRAILELLKRYKHKCEWFRRDELFQMWAADTQRGEEKLAAHLYEYLHDQGLNFYIEPSSASGKIDLISAQLGEDPLLADAKIFNPEKYKDKSYIADAFNQLYIYTQDFNQPIGYLIIYKTCPEDLRLALSDVTQSTPYLLHNNKIIFAITIDIFPHEKSASKRGKIKAVEVDQQYIVQIIKKKK